MRAIPFLGDADQKQSNRGRGRLLISAFTAVANAAAAPVFLTKWGSLWIAAGLFNYPQGVAVDSLGNARPQAPWEGLRIRRLVILLALSASFGSSASAFVQGPHHRARIEAWSSIG